MAVKANLIMDQGATFNTTINVTDANGNTIVLSGYSGYAQMKRAYSSINVAATFVVNIFSTNGQIQLTMNAATTANLWPGRYVYDVLAIDPSNNFVRIVEGELTVTPQVTNNQLLSNITIVIATSNISAILANDSSNVVANLYSGEE